jgi:hypothetical protein
MEPFLSYETGWARDSLTIQSLPKSQILMLANGQVEKAQISYDHEADNSRLVSSYRSLLAASADRNFI